MKLYEITNELQNIFFNVDEETGEMTPDAMASLEGFQMDFENKAIAIASYIKNVQAEENAISAAIADMVKRKGSLTRKVESLSDYLQSNLQKLSINEIKSSPYFKIRLKTCPPSVDVFDESQIPAEFIREKVTVSVDKIALKEMLNEGVDVPGACLQRKIKLEIK